jgi:hypothetical protein
LHKGNDYVLHVVVVVVAVPFLVKKIMTIPDMSIKIYRSNLKATMAK